MLERGGTRPGTSNVESILEADENGPSPLPTPRPAKNVIDPVEVSSAHLLFDIVHLVWIAYGDMLNCLYLFGSKSQK